MDNEKLERQSSLQGNDIFISAAFRRFLFPTILSLLGASVCNIADSAIVGNVMGTQGLAAMSLVSPLFFICTTLGSLIGVGGATLASIRVGRGDIDGVNRMLTLSLSLLVLLGLSLSAAGLIFIEPLLDMLYAVDGELREMARDYCLAFIPGALANMILYIPLNFLRITGKPGAGAWMFGIMAVSNIAICLVLLLSFDMGLKGVGLAMVLGSAIALLYGFGCFFKKDCPLRFAPFFSELKQIPSLIVTGSPMALTNLLTFLRTLGYNHMLIACLGVGGVSVFAVLGNVSTFALALLSGVWQTIAPLTGVFYGERDTQSVRRVMFVSLRWGFFISAAFALLVCLAWKPACLAFGMSDASLFPQARLALSLFGLSVIPAMVSGSFQSYYMTIRVVWLANLISACRSLILPVAISLLASRLSPEYVWSGFLLGELLTIPVFFVCARLVAKARGMSGVLLLDERDSREGKAIAFSVLSNIGAIMEASEKISVFCEQNRLDPKRSILISLSLEELLISISEHAFDEGETGSMDIRLFATGDDVVMRIRNGGREFDPIKFFENNPNDIDQCLGIQIIVMGAKEVKYTRTLGVNNLTVLI